MLAQLLKTLLLPPLPVMPFALALAFRSAAKPAPALRARERTAAAARMDSMPRTVGFTDG